jgi:hypothetical protein
MLPTAYPSWYARLKANFFVEPPRPAGQESDDEQNADTD